MNGGDEESFNSLVNGLKKALQPVNPAKKVWPIWDNSRAVNHFHTILVEKNIRFPPIKARPTQPPTPNTPGSSSAASPTFSTNPTLQPLHSPISPLTPSSPLYPDGIIAPIWIRKHREMIPSVFILILNLSEYTSSDDSPLETSQRKEEYERSRDQDLISEILDRKRLTLERGIKLAVILLCSRTTLMNDVYLDTRLSFIRRSSGLDSRASLFVISPVPQSEIVNFVSSLRNELYPAALDYYKEHGRRVRRKRARQSIKGGSGLSEKGWNVRYDYKMALFSEMRGEIEIALKHYEDCYVALLDMFGNNALLPPRTKRWAEAKVLADCLTVKVAKMYLYLNEASAAVAQLVRHVTRFRELSNAWGIGDKTFEFWSWLSKQYRLFGDLVAMAIRSGFRLPLIRPQPSNRALPPGGPPTPISSIIPEHVLQHPGHYFFLAAACAVERRERFRAVMVAYEAARDAAAAAPIAEGAKKPQPLGMGPALTHETKVDHAEVIIELYTKSYEFFKAHKTKNMTFYVAAQIALTHYESGNHEMALKFHDRIAKNYRRDKWSSVLDSILQLSFESAKRIEDWEVAIRCCLELMAPTSHISDDERAKYSATALELMQAHSPPSPEKAKITISSVDSAPLFDSNIIFWKSSVDVGFGVPFQLVIESPTTSRASNFIFSQLQISFSDERPSVVVTHSDTSEDITRFPSLGDGYVVSNASLEGDLCWKDGTRKIFQGVIESKKEGSLSITSIELKIKIGEWTVVFLLDPNTSPISTVSEWHITSDQTMALAHDDVHACLVSTRRLQLGVSIEHASPALVGEAYPIHIDVTNEDEVEVDVYLDILLQPGEDDSPNQIRVEDQASLSFIKGIELGTISPGSQIRKTMWLDCVGAAGDRFLDLSIRATPRRPRVADLANGDSPDPAASSFTDVLQSLAVSAIHPLHYAFQTLSHQKRRPLKPLLDLAPPDGWDGASDLTVVATMHAAGPWDVVVTGLRLLDENLSGARVIQSSLPALAKSSPLIWHPGHLFNCLFQLEIATPGLGKEATGAFVEVLWCRSSDESSQEAKTIIPFPRLQPFPLEPSVSLVLPPTLLLHEPATLRYKFSNPTSRVVTLSTSVEGAEPGTFTFAGPRKFPSLVLAPDEERVLFLVVIPLVVGICSLPRMRVFHHERVPVDQPVAQLEGGQESNIDPSAPRESTRRAKELRVVAETEVPEVKDPAQLAMEENLRAARGGDRIEDTVNNPPPPAFLVTVLPR